MVGHVVRRIALGAAALLLLAAPASASARGHDAQKRVLKEHVDRIVVIYQENHSFDNLWGGWDHVDGHAAADPAHTTQVDQAGNPFPCLPQNDVNISPTCPANKWFSVEQFLPPTARTCPNATTGSPANGVKDPAGDPGGCTRDLVHRFYQEQYQLDGGKQDRYTTGSDALGLTQGYYATRRLPVYRYLHRRHHPRYVISDAFFQAAFGGSFLNHQWLIAARTPYFTAAATSGPDDQHSITDA